MAASTRWPAAYTDGKTATVHQTNVWFGPQGLTIDAFTVWPYHLIRLVKQPGTPAIRLETAEEFPQSVTVADPAFRKEIATYYPALEANAEEASHTFRKLAILAGGTVVLIAVLWIWVLPAMVVATASVVPISFEEKLGETVSAVLAHSSRRCTDPKIVGPVEEIVRTLEKVAPSPYRYRVYVVDDPIVNAFAAPGGFVVVNRGLMQKTRTPEELAGVLAHEMQHVIQRHSTRAMLRSFGISILTAYIFGDASGLASMGAQMGEMAYMRDDEANADREGMRMMQRAQLDPDGIVRLMQLLEKEHGSMPKAINYFSTHPNTGDRVAAMRKMAAEADYSPKALLPGVRWPPSFTACKE